MKSLAETLDLVSRHGVRRISVTPTQFDLITKQAITSNGSAVVVSCTPTELLLMDFSSGLMELEPIVGLDALEGCDNHLALFVASKETRTVRLTMNVTFSADGCPIDEAINALSSDLESLALSGVSEGLLTRSNCVEIESHSIDIALLPF